jgi:hypothetical protein
MPCSFIADILEKPDACIFRVVEEKQNLNYLANGGNKVLQNVGKKFPTHTASCSRRL